MPRSVLLVDPDVDFLGAFGSRLKGRGFSIVLADSLERALEVTRREPADTWLVSDALLRTGASLEAWCSRANLQEVPRFLLVRDATRPLKTGELSAADFDGVVKHLYALPTKAAVVVAERGDVRGDLRQIGAVDLLQMLSMNRRTGVLSLTTRLGAGEVRLVEGEIYDAAYRRLEGEKALFRLLGETEGGFSFSSTPATQQRRLEASTSNLLFDGMRELDEVRAIKGRLGGPNDAFLAVERGDDVELSELGQAVAKALTTARTFESLLDELSARDSEILMALSDLLARDLVRKITQAAARVPLGASDQLAVLAALLKRRGSHGFIGRPRIVLAGPEARLSAAMHALGRIADANLPSDDVPRFALPYELGTLRLSDLVEVDVIALPLVTAFAPLWALTIPGSIVVARLGATSPAFLTGICEASSVPIVEADALLGEVDEADPAQMAALLRQALEAAVGDERRS